PRLRIGCRWRPEPVRGGGTRVRFAGRWAQLRPRAAAPIMEQNENNRTRALAEPPGPVEKQGGSRPRPPYHLESSYRGIAGERWNDKPEKARASVRGDA